MNDEHRLDELLDQAVDRDKADVSRSLHDRVAAVLGAFGRLPSPPTWITRAQVVGTAQATVAGVTTRSSGTRVFTEAIDVELPEAFDSQVNVNADGATLSIELDVEPSYDELWATIEIADTQVSAPFETLPADPRLRTAVLPFSASGPITIQIVHAPEDHQTSGSEPSS